ncbi:phosphate/phosphite/phosphonate ABC transporter substrate-binding protein [Pelagibius marinus]|uniref:phosphate/phosphite/phosphonate ABC transporter substrate-binding protein n=1 Tax=Pelagibius marinus TaxID=2762760 RepID=UPI00187248C1|nr:PhnD/SsuA/transferrin family substrate-binding protein [Pelagibius marinus]
MRASLPMYELPGLEAATDAWWTGLAAALRAEGVAEVPTHLTRAAELSELWTAADLLFSQTCGYPLTHALAAKVTLLATPVYDVPGCAGGLYRSEILLRADDPAEALSALRGRRVAVNARDSQSGYSALRHAVAPLAAQGGFFGEVQVSGSHLASMTSVAQGQADVCAVDCVTYHLLKRTEPALTGRLRVLTSSAEAPALPYITRRDIGAEDLRRLRAGLARAIADPALAELRAALLIKDMVVKPLSDYDRILELEAAAAAAGYPELA